MWLEYVRDIAIILLALESLIIGILLLVTLGRLRELMRVLREEIQPVLLSLQETLRTVSGTAHIVSDTVVNPLVRVNSFTTGAMRAFSHFFSFSHRDSTSTPVDEQVREQNGQDDI